MFDMEGNKIIVKLHITKEFVILNEAGKNIQIDFANQEIQDLCFIDRFRHICRLL